MVSGAEPGGILQLLELIEEHRPEAVRDFREKFHLSVHDVGATVRYDEALQLMLTLLRDPTSWLAAAVAGWDHPWSYEAMLLADIHDLQHMSKVKRGQFKAYPRPWPARKTKLGGKRQKRRTATEVLALLRPQPESSLPA